MSVAEQRAIEAQRVIDNTPCPACGGDRLRQDFTGSGACHAAWRIDMAKRKFGESLITDPPPDAPPAPDEGMVWVDWQNGPPGWEYPQDIGS